MPRVIPAERIAWRASDGGLTTVAVAEARARFGPNDIVETGGSRFADLARDTARDPMLWFLVGTSILYLVLGEIAEAAVLGLSILPLAGMDAYLHRRTQASTRGLRGLLAEHATVIREGVIRTVPVAELVVGDLVEVAAGQPFPADGVVVSGAALQVEESAITGESLPVRKVPIDDDVLRAGAPIDEAHLAMAGTRLLTGPAQARIIYTGSETMYGAIVRLAVHGGRERTPLQRSIDGIVRVLLVVALALCGLLFAVRLLEGHGWIDAIVSAATLAVAALPEEFPVIFTIFLGVGVYRLGSRRALVRRAVAVENIGRVTCLATDKTGTVTEGRLALVDVEQAGDDDPLEVAAGAVRAATDDPLDAVILVAAAARGARGALGELVATFPFTEDRRRETSIRRSPAGTIACCKGAPETIFKMVRWDGDEAARWLARLDALAAEGHKVIACARRTLGAGEDPGVEPSDGYAFAGLLAIADPLRAGIVDAVAWCRDAGVRVILMTGDHPATARAIARQMGLGPRPIVVDAAELVAQLPTRPEALRGVDVIARAFPADKLAIVRSLRAAGEVVAVTGDGVNDVPALTAADVGIAMGARGTRAAREVSAIVLADDDFASIVAAIGEGRALFGNLRRSFLYLLLIHIPFVASATLVPLLGEPLIYLPIHIVWLELLIHPTALLAFQQRGDAAPTRGRRSARLLDGRRWAAVTIGGGLLAAAVVLLYRRDLGVHGTVEHARAIAIATLAITSALLAAVLSRLGTRAAWLVAAGTLGASVLLLEVPTLAALLHVAPLHLDDWALAATAAALPIGLLVVPLDRDRDVRDRDARVARGRT